MIINPIRGLLLSITVGVKHMTEMADYILNQQRLSFMKFAFWCPFCWNWNNIYASTGTTDTRDLIHYIKSNLSLSGGVRSTAYFVNNFLESIGYSTDLIFHNNNRVQSSIINGKPVFMSGFPTLDTTSISFKGHGWVCEGYKSLGSSQTTYTLWVIDIDPYPSYNYIAVESAQRSATRPNYYYMNWGLGNVTNTWYITDDVRPSEDYYEFSFWRKDIVDIAPEDD